MKKILLMMVMAFAGAAHAAAPSCWVVNGAVNYTSGTTADGRFGAWWCPIEPWGDHSLQYVIMRTGYVLIHPPIAANASPADTALAYWNANVNLNCLAWPPDQPDIGRLCNAAYAAGQAAKPPSRWIITPYTGATYRATYPITQAIGGTRSTKSNGRVPIVTNGQPTPCSCTAGRVQETNATTGVVTTYCVPQGAPTPLSVANCRLR